MLTDFFEPMCMLNWISQPDGQGGILWTWADGAPFEGGIVRNSTAEMTVALQTGAKAAYTITTLPCVKLERGDSVKRLRDGAVFRITSDSEDRQMPAVSSIQYSIAGAERVEV